VDDSLVILLKHMDAGFATGRLMQLSQAWARAIRFCGGKSNGCTIDPG
jgi:hypothetical protein